ncbi:chemotaxis protein CheR [bacterium]|nr:chemotaxis protein CheR [bacterium]
MTATAPGAADLDRFRIVIRDRLGLQLDESERDGLADLLRDRIRETDSQGIASYMNRLASPVTARAELRALAERITVGETYFFRNRDQLGAFVDTALRDRCHEARRTLRVLSAGCASGEEAYTIAILLRENLPDLASWRVTILGIDINASLLEKARRARYSAWSLRQVPESVRERFFRPEGRELVLDEAVRGMVSFEERNILDEDPAFWRPESFDVIFFRNVAIYLSPDGFRSAVARFAGAISPRGLLFLGDAETLRNVSLDFHLLHAHGAFYYRRREGPGVRAGPARTQLSPSAGSEDVLPAALLDASDSWVEAIHRASERIASLVRTETATPSSPPDETSIGPESELAGSTPRPSWNLGPATDLVRQERFAEALELLRVLPPESEADPDIQLLRAAVLTNRGSVAEAERVCELVLALDELNAGAHYLKALCREHAGDRAGAAEHDRTAAYLDPAFSMPHLHMGLLAKRAGDRDTARSEIGRALDLLAREDASRVLLFGGGFNREALVLLCRAELRACGGAR